MYAKSTPEILAEYHKLLQRDGRDKLAFVWTADLGRLLDYIRELEQRIANLEDSEDLLQGLMEQLRVVQMVPDA